MFVPAKLKPVHFAVRPAVIAKHLGQVLTVIALLSLVPLLVSLFHGRYDTVLRYGIVIAGLLAVSVPCSRLSVGRHLQRNEALAISGLVFVLPPFALAIPLMSYGLSYGDAIFEVISGITTTGLSVLGSVEQLPFPFHFARAWLQWIGGLGVIVLSVAFLLQPGTATRHLGFDRAEVDDVVGGMRAHAQRVLIVYALVTLLGILALMLTGLTIGDSVLHTFAAISTGGFSNYDTSLAALPNSASRITVIVICLLGAIPFFLFYAVLMRRFGSVFGNPQLQGLFVMVVLTTAAIYLFQWRGDPGDPLAKLEIAALTAISAQSTAGFSVIPYDQLQTATVGMLIAAMLIGGGLGSTAGGIKILRLMIVVKFMHLLVLRCSVPESAHVSTTLGGRRLEGGEIESAAAIVLGYFTIAFISVIVFLAYGYEPLDSIFDVASAVGTAGLSSGLSGPELPGVLKAVLCVDMLMGRVETVALIVLLFPGTWIGKRYKQ
ncbi:TrkH family potassium uptake protein [Minwuia sp.]|uniref:TrkH family potassium uptake protein n=1 Tax=Minwuia sp. TaxID=2493630 RepID=UPI003A917E15